jgi:hypothetical protein
MKEFSSVATTTGFALSLAAILSGSCTQFNVSDAEPVAWHDASATDSSVPLQPGGPPDGQSPSVSGTYGDRPDGGPSPLDGSTSPSTCNVGDLRCSVSGSAVEVCSFGGGWTVREPCQGLCAGGSCQGSCHPGEVHCGTLQTPETCSDSGQWMPNAQPCPYVCTAKGQCAGVCKPGSRRCASGMPQIESCDENGTWVAGATCMNICSSGSCGGSCVPGTKRCGANQTPETCSSLGTWEPSPTPCPFVCSGQGDCTGVCKPGQRQCAGMQPQVCGTSGMWADSGKPCPNICTTGNCTGQCSPGDVRCSGLAPQKCTNDGMWSSQSACPNVCSNGSCTGICSPGSKRCGANAVQTCSGDGSRWDDGPACNFGCTNNACSACSPMFKRDCSQACTTGTIDCNGSCQSKDKADGTSCGNNFACHNGTCPRSCSSDSDCVSSFVCSSGKCVKPVAFGGSCQPAGVPCEKGGNCIAGFCCASFVTECGHVGDCTKCGSTGTCDFKCGKTVVEATGQHWECHDGDHCDRTCDRQSPDGMDCGAGVHTCDNDNFCDPVVHKPGT